MTDTTQNVGTAYAFFYCAAPREEIEAEIPTLRECAQTPSALELSLTEGMENVQGNPQVVTLAQDAGQQGMRYVLQATYPQATNKATANEVADILNQANQSPLWHEGEEYRGAVVYWQDNDWVFRE
ncbi:MAG TPA: hypothetical protein VJC21_03280 [Candidatus Nanoarchaeia archaeon]|nr:hypothetical protein [Candidatus Nanoarchaeia archaeon]